jgi:muconolactone delta-isomerase
MNKLVAASLESRFKVFDCRTQHPVEGFAGVSEKVRARERASARALALARRMIVHARRARDFCTLVQIRKNDALKYAILELSFFKPRHHQ